MDDNERHPSGDQPLQHHPGFLQNQQNIIRDTRDAERQDNCQTQDNFSAAPTHQFDAHYGKWYHRGGHYVWMGFLGV
jgi:hypothetical protein